MLAGIAGAVAFGGTFGQVLALVLIGLGCVLATGLVFLEVGLSEDRERAREAAQAERAPAEPRPAPAHGLRLPERRSPRLQRLRGSRRRLR